MYNNTFFINLNSYKENIPFNISNVFKISLLRSPNLHLFYVKYNKNSTVKYYYNLK